MKKIKKLKSKSELETATVYTYVVVDDMGNEEDITSLQVFKEGDRIESWFDAQYNKPKMRLYKSERSET